jgi:hypothetical protein
MLYPFFSVIETYFGCRFKILDGNIVLNPEVSSDHTNEHRRP